VSVKKRRVDAGSSYQEDGTAANITIVKMWFCFVFGVACVTCGIVGIWASYSQDSSSIYFAWLASVYVPVLRANAVACLVLGAILVRRGWTLTQFRSP
jgi:predicted membrane metal-binding protein